MEVKFRTLTYEEVRAEHFEALKNKAERKMTLWAARSGRSSPHNLADPAYIKASEFGKEYNFYKDALDALAAAPKWISVEEKHPDAGEWVLTYCGGYAKWFGLNKWCGDCWLNTMPITHWMPLPEPPKEEA